MKDVLTAADAANKKVKRERHSTWGGNDEVLKGGDKLREEAPLLLLVWRHHLSHHQRKAAHSAKWLLSKGHAPMFLKDKSFRRTHDCLMAERTESSKSRCRKTDRSDMRTYNQKK
jgi:hypothetical protein